MLKNGGGSIVNTASVAGLQGLPTAPAYVAAKHGVAGLTKTAALEFAQRAIRINAVCPGFVRTPLVDRCLDKAHSARSRSSRPSPCIGWASRRKSPKQCCGCARMRPRS